MPLTLISDNQSPEVLQPSKKPLDFPAALIPPQLSAILSFWLRAVSAVRRDHLNAVLFQKIIVELVAVISFVANEFFRFFSNEKAGRCCFRQLYFMNRSTCKAGGDRKTGSVRNGHDPAPFAAFCPSGRIAPFFAAVNECLSNVNAATLLQIRR